MWNDLEMFETRFYIALDTLNTSLTMIMVLFINLVVSHSLSASLEMSSKAFYLPKIFLCFIIFFSMWRWQYADKVNYLAYFQNNFERDEEAYAYEIYCF